MSEDSQEDRVEASQEIPVAGNASIQVDPPGEIEQRRGEGRRVNLIRNHNGEYAIYLRNRCVQSFCGEWEDITRFQLPEGIQQQIRINIEVLGQAREYEPQNDGMELRVAAHPQGALQDRLRPSATEVHAGQIRQQSEEEAARGRRGEAIPADALSFHGPNWRENVRRQLGLEIERIQIVLAQL